MEPRDCPGAIGDYDTAALGYVLDPGSRLCRPGQVHQRGDLTGVEGTLILFRPDFLDAATADAARTQDPHDPVLRLPLPDDATALRLAAEHLGIGFRALGHLGETVVSSHQTAQPLADRPDRHQTVGLPHDRQFVPVNLDVPKLLGQLLSAGVKFTPASGDPASRALPRSRGVPTCRPADGT